MALADDFKYKRLIVEALKDSKIFKNEDLQENIGVQHIVLALRLMIEYKKFLENLSHDGTSKDLNGHKIMWDS